MTRRQGKPEAIDVQAFLAKDGDYLRTMVEAIVEATLEAEMTARSAPGRGSGLRSGWATAPAITAAR